jgi:hypothetical protein
MATIELDTKRLSRVIAVDQGSTKKSREGGDIVDLAGNKVSWKCKNNNDSYLVWFRDFETDAEAWPFATGPDPVANPPVAGITKYLRVNSNVPRELVLVNTGSHNVMMKYFALDERDVNGVAWLDPMVIIRPRSLVASRSVDSVLLGVVCAVLGAAIGAAVTYAMM